MLKPLQLLSAAFNNYRDNFRQYFGIIVVPYLGMLLLVSLVIGLLSLGGREFWALEGAGAGILLAIYAAVIVAVVAFIVVSVWAQVAFWSEVKAGGRLGIREAFRSAKGMIFPYFWTSILVSIITVIGFFLLIIPGIIFAMWYLFAQMLVVLEGVQGTDALRRSKAYVKGHLGAVLWRVVFMFFVLMLVLMPLSIFSEDSPPITFLYYVLSVLAAPLYQLYVFEIYKNLKEIKSAASQPEEEAASEPDA